MILDMKSKTIKQENKAWKEFNDHQRKMDQQELDLLLAVRRDLIKMDSYY